VSVGGLSSLLVCLILDRLLGAFTDGGADGGADGGTGGGSLVATTPWWQPFAALAALVVFARVSGTHKSSPTHLEKGMEKARST
jgi:hypothetical protein